MKIITTLSFMLAATVSFAQLTVKPNGTEDNFIYVKDEVLYVKEDVKLEENADPGIANIYLRYEGQLIQGTTGTTQNSGTGRLSVFQEGAADEYAYNYWASPIGEADGTTGNSNFGIPLFYTPTSTKESTPITSINGYTSYSGIPVAISKYWIWKFTGGTEYADWEHVQDNLTIPAGYGFSMKGVRGISNHSVDGRLNNPGSAQRYDFRGKPNDGTISIPILADQEILVGNPYPSALELSYFLLENSGSGTFSACTNGTTVTRRNAITGVAYFWDSNPAIQSHNIADYVGGYETFAPVDCSTAGVYTPATFYMYTLDGEEVGGAQGTGSNHARRYSPIGQGFFVKGASGTPVNLQFKNTHRIFVQETNSNSEFHRYSAENASYSNTNNATGTDLEVIPKLRLNISFNDQYTRQLALAFWPTATDGVDAAMDAKNSDVIASDAGFFHDGKSYVIDVRQFDETQQIPLFLELATQKTIKFRVNTGNFENFDVNKVYILDKSTETYHPVKNQTFSITLPQGNYHERFKLAFLNAEEQGQLDVENEIKYVFDIFQNNNSAQLEIRNPDGVEIKSVGLYDLTGKQVFAKLNLGSQDFYTFPTRNLQQAIYLVKLTTADNKEIAKKISISNRN